MAVSQRAGELLADRTHRYRRVPNEVLGDAPDEQVRDASPAVRAHHDRVGAHFLEHREADLPGMSVTQEASRHFWRVLGHGLEDRLGFVGQLLNGLGQERRGD